MRLDKLTTKFQEALAEAQSLALKHDNPYVEPAHLLTAMLQQEEAVVEELVDGRVRDDADDSAH